jgi:signal peptidase I
MARARARKSRSKNGSGDLLRLILGVAILAWLIRSFLFAPFSIPSGSMLPTLYIGDYLMVAKWPYGFSRYSFPFQFPSFDGRILSHLPKRGDVVVFAPPGHEKEDYVKRVIGLPGDSIEVRHGSLILNGKAVARNDPKSIALPVSVNSPCRRVAKGGIPVASANQGTCAYASYRETLPNGASYRVIDQLGDSPADEFGPVTVPADRLFLMGDNRDDSLDSRFTIQQGGIGFVPLENLVGRATILFWSTDGSSSYVKPWTWFTALRGNRLATSLSAESK